MAQTITIEGRAVPVEDKFFSLSPEEQNKTVDEIAKSPNFRNMPMASGKPATSEFEAFLRGGAAGLTANWYDELAGAAEVNRGRLGFGGTVFGGTKPLEADPEKRQKTYEQARDEVRARQATAQREHPYWFGTGEFGGAAVGTLALPEARAATVLGRAGQAALSTGLYGAASGAGAGEGPQDTLTQG